jgi:hypothetical protein
MGIANVAGLRGWSVAAVLSVGAAVGASCVDTSGSRDADLGEGDDSGSDAVAASSGSSSGGSSSGSGGPAETGPATTPDLCGFPSAQETADASLPIDASPLADAALASDASPPADASPVADAATPSDASPPLADASLLADGASPGADAAPASDASPAPSASSPADASSSADASLAADGSSVVGPLPSGILYSGFVMGTAMACASNIPSPRNGSWFNYHDSSDDAGSLIMSAMPEMGGCGGMSVCAFHAHGPTNGAGFPGYGAGVGFDLNDNAASPPVAMPYNALAVGYRGIQFWAKGTITGTRGPGYASSPQTIHLKLPTATNRMGDDYGFYCQMIDPVKWTLCMVDFAKLSRDGFEDMFLPVATDMFDSDSIEKVQFEFSTFSTDAVAMDVWIDEVSFY